MNPTQPHWSLQEAFVAVGLNSPNPSQSLAAVNIQSTSSWMFLFNN